uniref:BED-type domain-containing protein n=1 Tax=Latimeria chalumnae TaxID=7897 RepID=H2ZW59_LATCH
MERERERYKSQVWSKFAEAVNKENDEYEGYVMCLQCDALYKYDSYKTGTSNLSRHVCGVGRQTAVAGQSEPITSHIMADATKVSSSVKSELVNSFVDMCCTDLRPFGIVSGEGFKRVAQSLINIGARYGSVNANMILPNRQTACDRAKQKAKTEKEKLSRDINKALENGIAITMDMWTDDYNKGANTVASLPIWRINARVIATVEFNASLPKTAENLAEQMNRELQEFGIPIELVPNTVFVSDQGANIKAALWHDHWIPCTVPVLNTALKHTFDAKTMPEEMKDVVCVIKNCKNLVRCLKKTWSHCKFTTCSNTRSARLTGIAKQQMMESVRKQFNEIRQLLEDGDQLEGMNGIQLNVLKMLTDFLSLFKQASEEIKGDKHPTIDMVLLWFYRLKKHCDSNYGDPEYLSHKRAHVVRLLKEKLVITSTHNVSLRVESTRHFETCHQCQSLVTRLRPLLVTLRVEKTVSKEFLNMKQLRTDNSPNGKMKSKTVVKMGSSDTKICGFQVTSATKISPDFWKNQETAFPQLSRLARMVLCIPASSATSKHNFSSAGRVIESRRNRLNPETVGSTLFLHSAAKSHQP